MRMKDIEQEDESIRKNGVRRSKKLQSVLGKIRELRQTEKGLCSRFPIDLNHEIKRPMPGNAISADSREVDQDTSRSIERVQREISSEEPSPRSATEADLATHERAVDNSHVLLDQIRDKVRLGFSNQGVSTNEQNSSKQRESSYTRNDEKNYADHAGGMNAEKSKNHKNESACTRSGKAERNVVYPTEGGCAKHTERPKGENPISRANEEKGVDIKHSSAKIKKGAKGTGEQEKKNLSKSIGSSIESKIRRQSPSMGRRTRKPCLSPKKRFAVEKNFRKTEKSLHSVERNEVANGRSKSVEQTIDRMEDGSIISASSSDDYPTSSDNSSNSSANEFYYRKEDSRFSERASNFVLNIVDQMISYNGFQAVSNKNESPKGKMVNDDPGLDKFDNESSSDCSSKSSMYETGNSYCDMEKKWKKSAPSEKLYSEEFSGQTCGEEILTSLSSETQEDYGASSPMEEARRETVWNLPEETADSMSKEHDATNNMMFNNSSSGEKNSFPDHLNSHQIELFSKIKEFEDRNLSGHGKGHPTVNERFRETPFGDDAMRSPGKSPTRSPTSPVYAPRESRNAHTEFISVQDRAIDVEERRHKPDIDQLVSRIDDVLHHLINSGKIKIDGANGAIPDLQERKLRENAAELLHNLAILRRSQRNRDRSHCHESVYQKHEIKTMPPTVFPNPDNNIAVLRAKRDKAVVAIRKETQRLSIFAPSMPRGENMHNRRKVPPTPESGCGRRSRPEGRTDTTTTAYDDQITALHDTDGKNEGFGFINDLSGIISYDSTADHEESDDDSQRLERIKKMIDELRALRS